MVPEKSTGSCVMMDSLERSCSKPTCDMSMPSTSMRPPHFSVRRNSAATNDDLPAHAQSHQSTVVTTSLALHYVSTGRLPRTPTAVIIYTERRVATLPFHGVTRTTRYGPRSFAVAGPSTWNSPPASLRNCQIPSSFRRELKTELFTNGYLH